MSTKPSRDRDSLYATPPAKYHADFLRVQAEPEWLRARVLAQIKAKLDDPRGAKVPAERLAIVSEEALLRLADVLAIQLKQEAHTIAPADVRVSRSEIFLSNLLFEKMHDGVRQFSVTELEQALGYKRGGLASALLALPGILHAAGYCMTKKKDVIDIVELTAE